ncbi:HPP family protein [Paludibacterium paludis]|uniref:Membrane protein n=1 Tax=Paludibacterium paludis TaxID=1225769 RepID=A0A918UBG6_9NEIS|nr:HPP family protein [Paludibacterium paludis]GGY24951.1 membrane protein [Paludibacterium paludis]
MIFSSLHARLRGNHPLPARPAPKQILAGLAGGTLAIGALAQLADWQQAPWLMAPFGASCVLLFAVPDSPLAQPRSVIGGHLLASLVGLIVLKTLGAGPWTMALAVGLAIALMQASRTLHAPAGADPLVVLMSGKTGWGFLLLPVLTGSLLLVAVALLVNNCGRASRWPRYW